MMKHTPGPWAVNGGEIRDSGGTGFVLASLHGANESDANLIAAAPDLLAAAEWALGALAEPIYGNNSSYGREHAQLRAAIARAKGE